MKRFLCACVVFLCAFVCLQGRGVGADGTSDELHAEESFVQFQQEWMVLLHKNGQYGEEHVRVQEDASEAGVFVAEYIGLTEPLSYEVKKTDNKTTPYVGVLKYERHTFACRGKTSEEARKGPFQCTAREGVTEIFRYSKGKWIY